MHDSRIVRHFESRMAQYRQVAIGECQIYGADADLPVVRRVVWRVVWRVVRVWCNRRANTRGTLADVVRHCSELKEERLHADGERILRPLKLSPAQASDWVAFLRSLSR